MTKRDLPSEFRKLPSVDVLLRQPDVAILIAQSSQARVTDAIRTLLAQQRQQIAAGSPAPDPTAWPTLINDYITHQAQPALRPVINATGVIIHTNLGRAPLSQQAIAAIAAVGSGYSNLEFQLTDGKRGSRHDHPRALLCQLTGAEDAIVLNNCAAALYLVLAALCHGGEVVISRGHLVEIGGGFRIPDVLRQSGAKLVEVGTTNRTHLRDFADAITPQSAAFLRVHSSNFRQIGFVTMPELPELTTLAHRPQADGKTLIVIDDIGSGALLETTRYGLAAEPTVMESLAAGSDIVTFSGDKLLGGPQAGIVLGRRELIDQLRRHPMARALRVDKLTLAALDATLRSYLQQRAEVEIPIWQMIAAPLDQLQQRAGLWQQQLREANIFGELVQGESAVGGGSLPGETLPTWLLAISVSQPDQVAALLRTQAIPVVCRIQQDRLIFDARTVLPNQEEAMLQTIMAVCVNDR